MSTHFVGEGNIGSAPDYREFPNGNDEPRRLLRLNVYFDNPIPKKDGEYEVVDQDHRMTHLHVIDLAAKKPRRLTEGAFTVGSFDWSPDGAEIVFDHRKSPDASDGGSAGRSLSTCSGASLTCAARIACGDRPENGGRPANSSYAMIPQA